MGMFDTIAWADTLPTSPEMDELGLNKRDWEFQTKDFDCALDLYSVQGGRLHIRKFRSSEWVEGDPKAEHFMGRVGHLARNDPYWEFVVKTATIVMYDYRQSVMDAWDCTIEFEVVLKEGIVASIKLIEFTKESDAERKRLHLERIKEMQYQESRWINRFFFYTRPYRKTAGFLRRRLYSLADGIRNFANTL